MAEPRLEYELTVRQQPKAARMCGLADRRPIDPPPIIQLRVLEYPASSSSATASTSASAGTTATTAGASTSSTPSISASTAAPTVSHDFLQNPYYFMFASLASPDADDELHVLKDGKTRCTTGSIVSSLYHLKDPENEHEDAGFFVFPDLSVRTEGSYRLKLSLFEVKGPKVHHCKSIFSNPFYVYTAKKFPGMEESTPLSCSLADQGIKIRIRKEVRQRKPRGAAGPSSSSASAQGSVSGPSHHSHGPMGMGGMGVGSMGMMMHHTPQVLDDPATTGGGPSSGGIDMLLYNNTGGSAVDGGPAGGANESDVTLSPTVKRARQSASSSQQQSPTPGSGEDSGGSPLMFAGAKGSRGKGKGKASSSSSTTSMRVSKRPRLVEESVPADSAAPSAPLGGPPIGMGPHDGWAAPAPPPSSSSYQSLPQGMPMNGRDADTAAPNAGSSAAGGVLPGWTTLDNTSSTPNPTSSSGYAYPPPPSTPASYQHHPHQHNSSLPPSASTSPPNWLSNHAPHPQSGHPHSQSQSPSIPHSQHQMGMGGGGMGMQHHPHSHPHPHPQGQSSSSSSSSATTLATPTPPLMHSMPMHGQQQPPQHFEYGRYYGSPTQIHAQQQHVHHGQHRPPSESPSMYSQMPPPHPQQQSNGTNGPGPPPAQSQAPASGAGHHHHPHHPYGPPHLPPAGSSSYRDDAGVNGNGYPGGHYSSLPPPSGSNTGPGPGQPYSVTPPVAGADLHYAPPPAHPHPHPHAHTQSSYYAPGPAPAPLAPPHASAPHGEYDALVGPRRGSVDTLSLRSPHSDGSGTAIGIATGTGASTAASADPYAPHTQQQQQQHPQQPPPSYSHTAGPPPPGGEWPRHGHARTASGSASQGQSQRGTPVLHPPQQQQHQGYAPPHPQTQPHPDHAPYQQQQQQYYHPAPPHSSHPHPSPQSLPIHSHPVLPPMSMAGGPGMSNNNYAPQPPHYGGGGPPPPPQGGAYGHPSYEYDYHQAPSLPPPGSTAMAPSYSQQWKDGGGGVGRPSPGHDHAVGMQRQTSSSAGYIGLAGGEDQKKGGMLGDVKGEEGRGMTVGVTGVDGGR